MAQNIIHAGRVLNLYKRLGETPHECLERLRVRHKEYEHEVLSYAGRLDPMAEGVLLCLVGPANKVRNAYLDMSKQYVLDVLFGFSTDTYDILGKVMDNGDTSKITKYMIQQVLSEFRGTISQEYPPFSSKTVDGKALFDWARSGDIGTIVLPRKNITIQEISILKIYKISEPLLLSYIETSINQVQGNFRQDEIMHLWKKNLRQNGQRLFPCVTIEIQCSSGTYARSIAHGLGIQINIPALALHILRTKVGEYELDHSII